MTTPSRAAPLLQRIERILLDRVGVPITLHELRTVLRRQGVTPSEDRLRIMLSDRHIFTELSGERYVLRDHLDEPNDQLSEPILETQVFLHNVMLTARSYVILDIETSGLNPEIDQIVQLSVLYVEDGRSTRFREWFFQCDLEKLTPALQRTLHLPATKISQIVHAPSFTTLLPEIREALGHHALVIHNARFDMSFLLRAIPDLTNPVIDTMELALLLAPRASSHKLSSLVDTLAIKLEDTPANHLAQCHIALHIWEKANNQPWKQYVQEKLRKELHDACTREAHSHTRREREILEQLREVDENSAGSTLVEERKELLKRYQRDYEKLLSSAG